MTLSPRQTRFALIAGGVLVLAAAAAFVLNAFQNNLVFFFTPTQVLNGEGKKCPSDNCPGARPACPCGIESP